MAYKTDTNMLYSKYVNGEKSVYIDDQKFKSIGEIKASLDCFNREKKEAGYHTRLCNLAEADYVRTIKKSISYGILDYIDYHKCQDWLTMLEERRVDKRRHYEVKDHFNTLSDTLKEIIFTNADGNFQIDKILFGGLGEYYYAIECHYFGFKFQLDIPAVKKLTVENYQYACDGKMTLFYFKKEHILENIKSSYVESDIKMALDGFIDKKNEEKTDGYVK